jgi:hypothetical protein
MAWDDFPERPKAPEPAPKKKPAEMIVYGKVKSVYRGNDGLTPADDFGEIGEIDRPSLDRTSTSNRTRRRKGHGNDSVGVVTEQLYIIQRSRAKKLWLPPDWWRRFPPRLIQIGLATFCVLIGHDWGDWQTDDDDGPGEFLDDDLDSFMPYCSRKARPGEFAIRRCTGCGITERRWLLALLDAEAASFPRGELVSMED